MTANNRSKSKFRMSIARTLILYTTVSLVGGAASVAAAYLTKFLLLNQIISTETLIYSVAVVALVMSAYFLFRIFRKSIGHGELGQGLQAMMDRPIKSILKKDNSIIVRVRSTGSDLMEETEIKKHVGTLHDPVDTDQLLKIYVIFDRRDNKVEFRKENLSGILEHIYIHYENIFSEENARHSQSADSEIDMWIIIEDKSRYLLSFNIFETWFDDLLEQLSSMLNKQDSVSYQDSNTVYDTDSPAQVIKRLTSDDERGIGTYFTVITQSKKFRGMLLGSEIIRELYSLYVSWDHPAEHAGGHQNSSILNHYRLAPVGLSECFSIY